MIIIIFIIGLMLALIALLIYIASLEDECFRLRAELSRLNNLHSIHNAPSSSVRPCANAHMEVDEFA